MIFYYNGRKVSENGLDLAKGCLLIIGFGAIIFMFTLFESWDDVQEYIWQIILVLIMGFSALFSIFRKRGQLSTRKIEFKNSYLYLGKEGVPMGNLSLDIYTKNGTFERYHLWDNQGVIAVFSVYEDELSDYFIQNFKTQTNIRKISVSTTGGSRVKITAQKRLLGYDLDGGDYYIIDDGKETARFTPRAYAYDGKYKRKLLQKKASINLN